jgi:thioredoxin
MSNYDDLRTIPAVEAVMAPEAGPAVIDFWAPWCAPCRAMAPHFAAIAEAHADQPVRFYKIDTEANPELAAPFHVRSLPTTAFVLDGQILDVAVGALDARRLEKKVDWLLSKARGDSWWTRLTGGRG